MILEALGDVTRATVFIQDASGTMYPWRVLVSYIAKEMDLLKLEEQEDCDRLDG